MMDPSSPMHRKYVPMTRRRTYLDGHQDANGVTKSVSLCVCVRYKLGASHTESTFLFKWVARLIQIRSNIIYYNLLTAYTEPTRNAFSSPPENLFYSMDACGSRIASLQLIFRKSQDCIAAGSNRCWPIPHALIPGADF